MTSRFVTRIGLMVRLVGCAVMCGGLAVSAWGNGEVTKLIYDSSNHAELGRSGDLNVLQGQLEGTTFTIPLVEHKTPGMSVFPQSIRYGKSHRYVWIISYYRYFGGICLMDIVNEEPAFAAYGRNPKVSADGKRVVYWQDGIYGLLYGVCVNDFIVYPRVRNSKETMSRANKDVTIASENTPQMELATEIQWQDDSSFSFVAVENTRAAEVADDNSLLKCYLVNVTGAGDGFTTDTLKVQRAELTAKEYGIVPGKVQSAELDLVKLLKEHRANLRPVVESDWKPDVFNDPAWPLMPDDASRGVGSPDGKHLLSWGECGIETDSQCGIAVRLDDKLIVSCRSIALRGSDYSEKDDGADVRVLGPVSRLLEAPVWIDNTHVELKMQTDWAREALTGDKSQTRNWRVAVTARDGKLPIVDVEEIAQQ